MTISKDQQISKQNCWFVISPKKEQWICFSILTVRKYLKLEIEIKFQVFPDCQDRKTNSFVCFLGEITARQFCFEIYWPLGWLLTIHSACCFDSGLVYLLGTIENMQQTLGSAHYAGAHNSQSANRVCLSDEASIV